MVGGRKGREGEGEERPGHERYVSWPTCALGLSLAVQALPCELLFVPARAEARTLGDPAAFHIGRALPERQAASLDAPPPALGDWSFHQLQVAVITRPERARALAPALEGRALVRPLLQLPGGDG